MKTKIYWVLFYKILSPEITKIWEIAIFGYFGGLETNVEFHGFLWFYEFLKVSASIFRPGFFTYSEYISGVSSEKKHFTCRLP